VILLDTCVLSPETYLSLSLLETRILFINNVQLALSANDLAVGATFLY